MKKRLRKKLHKGEFQELGFQLSINLSQDQDEATLDKWWDDFFEIMKKESLVVCCGGGYELQFSVIRCPKGSVTPDQQDRLRDWLESSLAVESFDIGPLVDIWYPRDKVYRMFQSQWLA